MIKRHCIWGRSVLLSAWHVIILHLTVIWLPFRPECADLPSFSGRPGERRVACVFVGASMWICMRKPGVRIGSVVFRCRSCRQKGDAVDQCSVYIKPTLSSKEEHKGRSEYESDSIH